MSSAEKKAEDWPALLFIFIALPVAFTYGGMWIGIIVLIIGVVALGWSKRHEKLFPTKKSKD